MRCEEVRNGLADYLTGELTESERAEWQRHLTSCAACRTETAALEDVWTRLGDIPAEPFDHEAMRARFDGMIAAHRPEAPSGRPAGLWGRVNLGFARWWPQQPVLQAGLAAVMFVAGLLIGSLATRSTQPSPLLSTAPPGSELAGLRLELHDMREMLALSLIQQSSATERLRGVGWSNQIEQPGSGIVSALLDTLLHDPNVNVRLAAVDALRRFSQQDVVRQGTVRALADSSSPLVQIAVIDFIVETRETGAIAELRRLSQDAMADEAVRSRAAWGLERLSS